MSIVNTPEAEEELLDIIQDFDESMGVQRAAILSNDEIEKRLDQRTKQQNKAMRKWWRMTVDELNRNGIDMREAFQKKLPASYELLELQWHMILAARYGKTSTTQQTKKETNAIYEMMSALFVRLFADQGYQPVEWPSEESK